MVKFPQIAAEIVTACTRENVSMKETQSDQRTVLGLDIGGTKTACVEGTGAGRILQRVEIPTHATVPFSTTFPQIAAETAKMIDTAKRAGRTIAAISVSVGGPLKIEEGFLIDPPHLPGWHSSLR
jgi:glucokinase